MISDKSPNTLPPDPSNIKAMFDAIATTYDVLNHLLSFGLDVRWRRRAVRLLAGMQHGRILDIAAGSGDFSFDAASIQPRQIVGVDFAINMLKVFKQKLRQRATDSSARFDLAACDALILPFRGGSFDVTMVAFGIRNFADRRASLREMRRVLRTDGVCLILELSQPTLPIVAHGYLLYNRIILPLIGRIISRHNGAYRYLPQSIAKFPKRSEFLAMVEESGFRDTRAIPLTFGVATIYLGRK
jgi:demethylmenaquinone methyltransferase/2-methoxy-6-polyprenyl-1,4-benzoquinol methylase